MEPSSSNEISGHALERKGSIDTLFRPSSLMGEEPIEGFGGGELFGDEPWLVRGGVRFFEGEEEGVFLGGVVGFLEGSPVPDRGRELEPDFCLLRLRLRSGLEEFVVGFCGRDGRMSPAVARVILSGAIKPSAFHTLDPSVVSCPLF